jgi:hypothetical protein
LLYYATKQSRHYTLPLCHHDTEPPLYDFPPDAMLYYDSNHAHPCDKLMYTSVTLSYYATTL